jgi:hypothetical protein
MKVRRLPCHDLVVDGDQSAVYVDDSVVVLSPISTAVLTSLSDDAWFDVDEIVASVETRFGAPPEGSVFDGICSVVHQLAATGLVERVD